MERMTGLFYCVVLLCLSGCLSTTVTVPGTKLSAKPGVCPLRKSVAGVCAEYCFNDSDCPNNEKCCSNGCGHQCTAPYTAAKPGVCPLKKYDAKTCTMIRFVSCANDSDCPKKEKCCQNGCGLQCMAPVTAVKPGVCPRGNIEAAMCPLIRYVPCGDDSHCAKNEKCCYNGCGLGCTAPVTAVKPGVCPRGNIEAAMCPLIRYVPCGDDSHCAKNEKCCYNGCGLGCTAPVTVNPGVCPLGGINPEMCPLIRFGQCVDDSDCANNQKCCNNGCGRQCVVTV